jgi:hypothetical protein
MIRSPFAFSSECIFRKNVFGLDLVIRIEAFLFVGTF